MSLYLCRKEELVIWGVSISHTTVSTMIALTLWPLVEGGGGIGDRILEVEEVEGEEKGEREEEEDIGRVGEEERERERMVIRDLIPHQPNTVCYIQCPNCKERNKLTAFSNHNSQQQQ